MSLHPMFARILDAHAVVTPNTYRGWAISFDFPPIPVRDFDWSATSPDYDCNCDQDGFYASGGQVVHAATRAALIEAIDAAIEEDGQGNGWMGSAQA